MPDSRAYVEPGRNIATGETRYRMRCDACNRNGVWQTDLTVAENTVRIHNKSEHEKAVA